MLRHAPTRCGRRHEHGYAADAFAHLAQDAIYCTVSDRDASLAAGREPRSSCSRTHFRRPREIDTAASKIKVQEARLPEGLLEMTGR